MNIKYRYLWTPSYETKVIEGGGTEETVYYYANGELIARKNNDDSITYYHTDHLGSTSVLTDENGDLVEATSYDPWGQVLSGGTMSRFQYTGKEKDAETGLNYYESRYYNSDIHRFVQPDTWLPDIYDPQQLNRYSYANNNPLKYTDPTGHFITNIINTFNLAKQLFSGNKQEQKKSPPPPPTSRPAEEIKGLSTIKGGVSGGSSNGGSINTSNSSQSSLSVLGGSTSSGSSPIYHSTTFNNHLPATGYMDVNLSSVTRGALGTGLGAQMNQKGFALYTSTGVLTPGRGGAITYSPDEIKPHNTTMTAGGSWWGGTVGLNLPFLDSIAPVSLKDISGGVAYPNGASVMINHTFSFHEWNDFSSYKFIQRVE